MDQLLEIAETVGRTEGKVDGMQKSFDKGINDLVKRMENVEKQIIIDNKAIWICRVVIVAIVGIVWKSK